MKKLRIILLLYVMVSCMTSNAINNYNDGISRKKDTELTFTERMNVIGKEFFSTTFEGGRHQNRINKIDQL